MLGDRPHADSRALVATTQRLSPRRITACSIGGATTGVGGAASGGASGASGITTMTGGVLPSPLRLADGDAATGDAVSNDAPSAVATKRRSAGTVIASTIRP